MVLAFHGPARAQLIDQYFQSSIPGFSEERGVTVLSRSRPLYAEPSVNLDGVTIRADLDESIAYNSNVDAQPGGPGSWVVTTAPSLQIGAAGPRGQLDAAFTLDDSHYLETPQQNQTNWTAALGGNYALGHDTLTLGYAHLNEHQVATELGAVQSTSAVPYQSDDLRASYDFKLGRLALTPEAEYTTFQFGTATVLGQTLDLSPQNRNVLTAGVTARYPFGINRNFVLVVQDIDTTYLQQTPGQPNSNSRSFVVLGGIDYQSSGVWRYRLLAGFERRSFLSSGLPTMTTPIVEGSAIWTPTGLTTVTATVSRRIEDSATPNIGSYTYTDARLVIDHELRHNVLLQGRANFQFAQYAAGGSQPSLGVGAGVTWLLGRRMRLLLDYDYLRQGAVSGAAEQIPSESAALVSGQYDQSLATLTLHIGL